MSRDPWHDREMMVDSIMGARGDPWPLNDPPGPKWKARKGLARLNLNGVEHDVMECLIDRANKNTGLCFPSEEFVAGWTNRDVRTVRRAIASLNKSRNMFGVVTIKCRSGRRNRYFINWPPLFAAFKAIKAFEDIHKSQRDDGPEVDGPTPNDRPEVDGGDRPEVAAEPWKVEPGNSLNLGHEVVYSPAAVDDDGKPLGYLLDEVEPKRSHKLKGRKGIQNGASCTSTAGPSPRSKLQ